MRLLKEAMTRTVRIDVRVSPRERATIKQLAKKAGVSVSDYIRIAVLNTAGLTLGYQLIQGITAQGK